jgi:class 3 adenylate cyclase
MYWENPDGFLDAIEEFLTGIRRGSDTSRVLATVLFTDIVGSTEQATALGDAKWRELLDRHDETARREIEASQGRLVKTTVTESWRPSMVRAARSAALFLCAISLMRWA